MPRMRVDRDTPEQAIIDEIAHLFSASHVIDKKLTAANLSRHDRALHKAARELLHDEIERLVNTIRRRRGALTSAQP